MGGGGSVVAVALSVVALAACEKPVPETPTFERDVRPIFMGNCVRCHGGGGTLNKDPRAFPPDAPGSGYLDSYEDRGDCTPDPATGATVHASCERGARYEADIGNIKGYVNGLFKPLIMPPPPSPPLTPWELAVVDNWLAETPPMP
jgi:hypothetical protein